MNIGFIGLGNMGSAIAGRLLEAGHSLCVWNRSPEPARRLAERGAQVAATAEEAFRGDVVFSMLSDDQATRAVLLDSGVLARATPGATRLHINLATISAALGDELAERHAERGVGYVAAPVLGRPEVAAAGKLTHHRGRSAPSRRGRAAAARGHRRPEGLARRRAGLAGECRQARRQLHAGGGDRIHGRGSCAHRGLRCRGGQLFELIGQSLFPGPVYQGYGRLIAEGRFEPAGFKARLGLKDVRLALAAAEAVTTPMPVGSVIPTPCSRRWHAARAKRSSAWCSAGPPCGAAGVSCGETRSARI